MGMMAILTDRDYFRNLSFPQPKAPYEIWPKLAQWLQKRSLKMLTDGRMDAGTDGRTTDKKWSQKLIMSIAQMS